MNKTKPTLTVLRSFMDAPDHTRYGYEVMAETGLSPSSVYPILRRLLEAGWLTSREEPSAVGRPGRRYYSLTELGLVEAAKMLAS